MAFRKFALPTLTLFRSRDVKTLHWFFFSFLFFLRPDFLHCNIQHILLKVQRQVQLLRAGSYKGGGLQSGPLGSSPGSAQTAWLRGSHCYCLCSVMLYKDGVGVMTSVV